MPLVDTLRNKARELIATVPRRERLLLAGAMALGFTLVVVYVLASRPNDLAGDQLEYNREGVFFTQGKLWWSTLPFGIPHAAAAKAPGYPAWVGLWYALLGTGPTKVALVQAFLMPVTVFLTWLLARRLFASRTAIAAAWVVAAFPLVWEFYGLLYPEPLAVPLTLLVLLLVLGREPTPARAAGVGALVGLSMLVRPTASFLLAGIAAAWIVAAGWRRGAAMTALTIALAGVVVLPWTVRNYVVTDGGFIPISVQDGAAAGTFNSTSANDPQYPYAWRALTPQTRQIVAHGEVSDAEFRSQLQSAAWDYIKDHPTSVLKAFYWNGLSRFWDVRRPSRAVDEAPPSGRKKAVTAVGLGMYYVLLPLALVGLWRLRNRLEIVVPVLALALAASVVFTIDATTRYRAPLEPLIVILACSLLAGRPVAGAARPPPQG